MKNMLLKDPERMMELFTLLHKAQSKLYQEKELNEAINNSLLLEKMFFSADSIGTQNFCAAMRPSMEKRQHGAGAV